MLGRAAADAGGSAIRNTPACRRACRASCTLAYSMEMLQLPNRVVIVYEGGTHIFRSIPIGTKADLKHPADPNPTYLGDSYGWWDGDSLMVDVVGFNDRTWLDSSGHPHGEKLHVVEKYTRLDALNLRVHGDHRRSRVLHSPLDGDDFGYVSPERSAEGIYLPGAPASKVEKSAVTPIPGPGCRSARCSPRRCAGTAPIRGNFRDAGRSD